MFGIENHVVISMPEKKRDVLIFVADFNEAVLKSNLNSFFKFFLLTISHCALTSPSAYVSGGYLFICDGLTHADISKLMGVSNVTMYKRIKALHSNEEASQWIVRDGHGRTAPFILSIPENAEYVI